MLSACGGSLATPPRPAADPIVETRTVIRRVCPAELVAPLPPRVATPADAAIEATREVLAWIGARFAREDAIEARLRDAAGQCPND